MKFFVINQNNQVVKWKYDYNYNRLVEKRYIAKVNQSTYTVSPYFFFFLINEINNVSPMFREELSKKHKNKTLVLKIVPPKSEFIDKVWGEIVRRIIWEVIEVDYLFSWLSTLGGAFSSLGDYYADRAQIAGKISINQLKIAFKIGDKLLQSRCLLYLSISLIQQNKFKLAQKIVRAQYETGISSEDLRLVKMSLGVWSKLQYSHKIYKTKKKNQLE